MPPWLREFPALRQLSKHVIDLPTGYSISGRYQWETASELLTVASQRDRMTASFTNGYCVARLNVETGQIRLLNNKAPATDHSNCCEFSPDGKWYLCVRHKDFMFGSENDPIRRQSAGEKRYYLCSTDDTEQHLVYSSSTDFWPNAPFAWFADSCRWLIQNDNDEFEVRTLAQQPGVKIPRPPWIRDSNVRLVMLKATVPTFINSPHMCYWDPASIVKAAIWDPELPDRLDTFDIPLPVDSTVHSAVLSPNGKRIAWLLHVEHWIPEYTRLQKILSPVHPIEHRRDSYQIWTTAVDGSSPLMIAAKEVKLVRNEGRRSMAEWPWYYFGAVGGLAWRRDGEELSFEYQNGIWIVPAPGST